ncbi:hypothetical protein AVEN_136383-1 [Araneus ventricosus]|uniref:Repressor of the inhibitor of the protein kinase n=1 Tax=Araneus ventricosus TaxID=182803 RepID=A0A4Y2M3E2_ARAVE|nr:hypothetical protein AVEN_136383-1 [Araneus ventricosus]
MKGQGYDGAAMMRGQFRGVQASIKEKLPLALYTHCSSHSLNLCLSDARNIPSIRNCMGVIKEVCRFFHMSTKRTEILKSMISDCCPEQKKKKLISLCETRWVERHDSVFLFKDILEPILLSLLKIEEESSDSAPKAHALTIANVTSVLDLLSTTNDNFKTLYAQVKEIAAKLDIKEDIPRVCRLQTARNNVSYSTEEEYYR